MSLVTGPGKQQIERHFSMNELTELYEYKDEPFEQRPVPKVPKDVLLAELIRKHPKLIWKYHDHDSLLENQVDENLTEAERRAAWEEFEQEKKGLMPLVLNKGPSGSTKGPSASSLHPYNSPYSAAAHAMVNGGAMLIPGGVPTMGSGTTAANINPVTILGDLG